MPSRRTLNDCHLLAKENGGKCLSKEYINSKSKLTWQCKEGHIWDASYDSIRSGSWCSICRRKEANDKKRLSIKDAQALAEVKGGKCLSNQYINNAQKLTWQCKEGHVWETPYSVIKMGHWCPTCGVIKNSSGQRFSIKNAKELATFKDGKCLSTEYKNARSRLTWKCKEGHIWDAPYDSIRSGRWCPYCAGKRPFDKRMLDEIAEKKGGKCLSQNYRPGQKVKWQCNKGHLFSSLPSSAKKGHWCPYCARSAPLTLEHAKKLAESRGGKCLSQKYVKSSYKLEWECDNGHRWKASYNSVSKGSWCPICSQGLGERLCRTYFEAVFGVKFPNTRGLSWLVNNKGSYLELDGYNDEMKIAFEHQGEHHYTDDHYFSSTNHDNLKSTLCAENGILLIEVPQIGKFIELNELPGIIISALERGNRPLIAMPKITDVDFSEAHHPKWMEELNIIAQEKGGRCLSSTYLGSNKKLKWECKEGHIWMSSPEKIKRGDWCDKCARIESGIRRSLGIESARDSAKKFGGICLSENYNNTKTKMRWQCAEGHTWEAIYSSVRKGHWCPVCANKGSVKKSRYTIDDARSIAKEKGGQCLSQVYLNNKTKLLWECGKGHHWECTLQDIIRGRWCKICNDINYKD